MWVTGGFFDGLGLRPVAGRLFNRSDDVTGCAPRAVLSHAFWQRAYGGNPAIVGQTLTLNARQVEIVGVAPAGFEGLDVGRTFDVAVPVCAEPGFSDDGRGRVASGTAWWMSVFGRLKPGWTAARAAAHVDALSPALFASTVPPNYPAESIERYKQFRLTAQYGGAGVSEMRQAFATPLWLLLGISGLVLVIACANLANLLLARATARQREIAIRLGLGASRGRIIRQLLTESLLLAIVGAASGLVLARWLGAALVGFLNTANRVITLPLTIDWRVALFTAGLAALTCVLFGLAPALRATRVNADSVMRGGGRGQTATREAMGLRRSLVVAQIALSIVLLFGSLLFVRSLHNAASVNTGFDARNIVIANVNFRRLDVVPDRRASYRRELVDRVRALPGVQSAALLRTVPVSGDTNSNDVWPEGDRSHRSATWFNTVGSNFFATLAIPFVAGRDFDDRDAMGSSLVAIVNETFVTTVLGGRPAIGARFTRQVTPASPETTFEIIGVVRNSTYARLKEPTAPVAFLSDGQSAPLTYLRVAVRSSLPPSAMTAAMTRSFADLDSRIALRYSVMEDDVRDTLRLEQLMATISSGFGVLAAVLTLVGLYGVVAYTVARRTNEIGVRMALGARAADIVRLVLRETGVMLGVGVILGVALAIAAGRQAATLLFGVPPHDPQLLLIAVGLLGVIALAATVAPARRATRIEPVTALRVD
jgi:predicted permease